jgi:ABC-type lipoprotein release transport system permease subunit
VRAPNGRRTTIDLAGTDTSLAVLDGLGETLPLEALRPGTVGLSKAGAEALDIEARAGSGGTGEVVLAMRGKATALRVSAVLGHEAIGALARALVAVMPLERMQQLAGLPGRGTRIFVEASPRQEGRVRSELLALAGGRLTVAPADQDVALLREALGPSALASGLFAAIGALLGLLFAFNAMLLTVPERRQAIADLRLAGTRRAAIVQMVLFEALCLGLAASLVGLGGGYVLSVGVFHQSSAYLAEAFTLGSNTVISARPVLLSLFGGVLATCVASAVVLLDLRRGRGRDAVYHQDGVAGDTLGRTAQRRLFAGALGLLAGAGALYALAPAAAIAATALLALGTVLAVPLVFAGVLALLRAVSDRYERLVTLPVALASLRTTTLTTTNLAWPPGVIFMSTADYSRLWATSAPTALGVELHPGADLAAARDAIERALGPSSGLEVATAATREASIDALTSEGLGQLQEIATLLLGAAICAMAAALASSLWQRREWLAGLRLSGAKPGRLRRILLLEATLMLGAGCMTGALAGVYGEVVIDGYLRRVTGFPLASIITGARPLEVFALVLAIALAIMAIPGWLVSRVSPGLALESD